MSVTIARRVLLAAGLAMPFVARAAPVLRIGDQRGGFKSVMQAAGVLSDAPFSWSLFPAAAPLLEAMNADAIDCGGVGDAPFAFAHASGAPIKVFAATRSTGANTAILVHAGSAFQTFADLKGKTIAAAKGSVGHYLVVAARDRAGLKPSDITIAFLSPADAGSAFSKGSVDAWATWSQYIFLAMAQGNARILLDLSRTARLAALGFSPEVRELDGPDRGSTRTPELHARFIAVCELHTKCFQNCANGGPSFR